MIRLNLQACIKWLLFCLFCAAFFTEANASHIRGGYISAKRLQGYRYEFILTIFRDSNSPIYDSINKLYPDAGISSELSSPVTGSQFIPEKETEILYYRYEYTYSSPGVYTAYHYQLFRNLGILNMDFSGSTTFYVETKVIIDPFLAPDQSPVITKAAVDIASIGSVYRYNPGAFDPDGDSLSYILVPSKQFVPSQGSGFPASVPNYRDPAIRAGGLDSSGLSNATLKLNTVTGELVWNVPRLAGEYNTAIKIVQWRKIRENRIRKDSIGFVHLDIQIIVKDANNRPPQLKIPKDTCIVAGAYLERSIQATDPDLNDFVELSLLGELTKLSPPGDRAEFSQQPGSSPFRGTFAWQSNCGHVRRQPYYAVFQAEDNGNSGRSFPLVDLKTWAIKVVGPAPVLKKIRLEGERSIRLSWQNYACSNASKIWIYRKTDSSAIRPDTCFPGMPAGNGFVKIAEIAASDTAFTDNNGGKGLLKGPSYCYRIVARFPEPAGGESLFSNELCQQLNLDIPVLLNVDVEKTDEVNGKIGIRWSKNFQLITPIFRTSIYRLGPGNNKQLIFSSLNPGDTSVRDSLLNTSRDTYRYQLQHQVESIPPSQPDSAATASSVRLELIPGTKKITLKWQAETPWGLGGYPHRIYKKNTGGLFELIDSIQQPGPVFEYVDDGSYNGQPLSDSAVYCYFVETSGSYGNPLLPSPLLNRSQEACANPSDTIRPCPPPSVLLDSLPCKDCEELKSKTEYERVLNWSMAGLGDCAKDAYRFKVYYSAREDGPLQLIGSTADTFFVHSSLNSLAGCYQVTSIDRSGNESTGNANKICSDNCIRYDLPNLFTPDGNGLNDKFTPFCFSRAFIENVRFTVYNRWGKIVYEDNALPEINWEGISEGKKEKLVPGIYFYLLEIKTKRLKPEDENQLFRGWVQIAE